jgi:hypothetical protein
MKNKKQYNKGEIAFGAEVLLFLLVIFVIWVLTGGATRKDTTKPFIKPYTDKEAPLQTYDVIKNNSKATN